jgi:type IV pilus assembly protein PilE
MDSNKAKLMRGSCSRNPDGNGFTLIELMITVAVVGILAAIVVPSYRDYVRRAALQESFANLSDLRVKLEQFYQSNRNYGGDPCGNDGTTDQVSFAPGGNFTYTCALSSANQAYLLTATGSSGAAIGHTYTLNSDNAKATSVFKGGTVNKSCWLVKGSEC